MSRFSTWSQMVLDLPSDSFHKDNMRVLRGMVKAYMSTITEQTLGYELGVSRI